MSCFSFFFLYFNLIILSLSLPKDSVASLKQQNQSLKDKFDDLSLEIKSLKEKFTAERAAASDDNSIKASNAETARSLQF